MSLQREIENKRETALEAEQERQQPVAESPPSSLAEKAQRRLESVRAQVAAVPDEQVRGQLRSVVFALEESTDLVLQLRREKASLEAQIKGISGRRRSPRCARPLPTEWVIHLDKGVNLFRFTDVGYYYVEGLCVRPRWRRLWHLPRLYRRYRATGVSMCTSLKLCWNIGRLKVKPLDGFEWYRDPAFDQHTTGSTEWRGPLPKTHVISPKEPR